MDIFLSYSHQDAPVARQIVQDLTTAGLQVVTGEQFAAGQSLSEGIVAAMDRADAFLILLSRHSLDSEWGLMELGAAVAQKAAADKPVIPVILERDAEIPAVLRDLRYVDFSDPWVRRQGLASIIKQALRAEGIDAELGRDRRSALIEEGRSTLAEEAAAYQEDRVRREAAYGQAARWIVALVLLLSLASVALAALGGDGVGAAVIASVAFGLLGATIGFYLGRLLQVERDGKR